MPNASPIPAAMLEIIAPMGTRRQVPVSESPFLIGRTAEAGNHLPLDDVRISRKCAALVYDGKVFRLEDRGQRSGVYVNGQKVSACALRDADTITFGMRDSTQLIFHVEQAEKALPDLLSELDKASSLDAGARDLRHLSLLLEATALLQSHLPLEQVLQAMLDRAITITDADRGVLLEREPAGGLRPLLARQKGAVHLPNESLAPSQTAIQQALQRRESVVQLDVSLAEDSLRDAHSIVAQELRSFAAIPLLSVTELESSGATWVAAPTEVLGVLYLDSRRPAAFSSIERQILHTLAIEAGSVLEKAQLVKKEKERQRMSLELDTARNIQQALLPAGFQQFPHLQVAGVNRSCLAVGGDYFDVIELDAQRTAFVIADVSGKGLGAALVTAMLQGTFSALSLGQQPANVCAHVNRYLCAHAAVRRHATLFFGILDTAGRLEYVNAGHLPAMLVHAGRVEPVFAPESFALGWFDDAEYHTAAATLEPGDTLVLFTDGINEALNPEREQFGLQGLRAAIEKGADASVEQLQAGILEAVEGFIRGEPQGDDITLLILRYLGHSPPDPTPPGEA
ncbi:MAG: SpoIIE family protein phosphatase [Candidatus Acidiferrales bacterium]